VRHDLNYVLITNLTQKFYLFI